MRYSGRFGLILLAAALVFRALLIDLNVDCHEYIHCVLYELLNFFSTEAIFCGFSLYSHSKEFSSILRWVALMSLRSLNIGWVTFGMGCIIHFWRVRVHCWAGVSVSGLDRPCTNFKIKFKSLKIVLWWVVNTYLKSKQTESLVPS